VKNAPEIRLIMNKIYDTRTSFVIDVLNKYHLPAKKILDVGFIGDYAFGNVLEEGKSFRDIWNSKKYKNYRNNLMYHKKLPLCKKCDE